MENLNRQNKKLTQSLIKRGVDANNFVRIQDLISLIELIQEEINALNYSVNKLINNIDYAEPVNTPNKIDTVRTN